MGGWVPKIKGYLVEGSLQKGLLYLGAILGLHYLGKLPYWGYKKIPRNRIQDS